MAGVAPAAALGDPVPPLVIADTRNPYAVPFVRPETTRSVVGEPVSAMTTDHVVPPSVDCSILYPVIDAPPVDDGAVHESATDALPGDVTSAVGTSGAPYGVTLSAAVAIPTPALFTAFTRNATSTPLVRPTIVAIVAPPVDALTTVQDAPPSRESSTR